MPLVFYPYKITELFSNAFRFNPDILTVYKSPYTKKRIGKNNDGGYIIDILPITYNIIIGCGINDDITFEEDFIKQYPGIQCIAFDGTIDKLPPTDANIQFVKKNIGNINTDSITNLHDIINANTNIFLKMDIEGAEITWFETLSYKQLNKFMQMVVEFHSPFSEKETNVFTKISKTHVLVHLHGNNHSGIKKFNDILVPEVFECTFINKKYLEQLYLLNTIPLPLSIDMPNYKYKSDYNLDYKPFVKKFIYSAK
jgi:hypothetical protein